MKRKRPEAKSNGTESQMTPTGFFYIIFRRNPFIGGIIILLILIFFSLLTFRVEVKQFFESPKCEKWIIEGKIIDSDKRILKRKISVGAMSGPFTIDNDIIDGNFRITDVEISNDENIYLYIIDELGVQISIYREPFREGKHIVDNDKCKIVFREPILISVKEFKVPSKEREDKVLQQSYFLKNHNLSQLDSSIALLGYVKNIENPTSVIEFSYSGGIEEIEKSNLFRYNGGFLKLLINGKEKYSFPNLVISSSANVGNTHEQVVAEINNRINMLVKLNQDQCLKKIKEFL